MVLDGMHDQSAVSCSVLFVQLFRLDRFLQNKLRRCFMQISGSSKFPCFYQHEYM